MRCWLAILFMTLAGCTAEKEPPLTNTQKELKVGMTYEEVEEILGKPDMINRGVDEVVYKEVEPPSNADNDYNTILAAYLVDHGYTRSEDSLRLFRKPEISNRGILLYVTWIYLSKMDTLHGYHIIPKVNRISEDKERVLKYDLDGYLFTAKQLERDYGPEWRSLSNLRTLSGMVTEYRWVVTGLDRKAYYVLKPFTVVFDASSGRMSMSGNLPFLLRE